MDHQRLHSFVINYIEKNTAIEMCYHKSWHTLDVIQAVEEICLAENINESESDLLKTAALLHDVGYVKTHVNHEHWSCEFAREHLPHYGYNKEDIERICSLIMATKLPQKPTDHLSEILCDADLYYLGDANYEFKANLLFEEMRNLKLVNDKEEWHNTQINFLSSHHYFTKTAVERKAHNKNLILKKLIGKMENHNHTGKMVVDLAQTVAGVLLAAFALNRFLVPNHFFDGGITGMSLLVHELYKYNLALVIFLFNLPLVVVSYFFVNKNFAVKTFIATILLGIALLIIPHAALTQDKLIISVFGGVFLGIGAGLVMRTGAAIDGIEVLALYTLKRTSFKISEIILGINILIFSIAAFYFGIETALYSVLTYFCATRTIDYVVEGMQSYTGVTIISGKSEEIKYKLVNALGRGITVYKGERGFLPGQFEVSSQCDIIFTVITRLELRRLTNVVSDIDPKAFIFANTIREASGGILKRIHRH